MNHRIHTLAALCCLACTLIFCAPSVFAGAIEAHEFANDSERLRFQALTEELRCPKCQNQNLADSNSEISIDLRREVARMVNEGKSNREIKQFLVARYGDFVLYQPPVQNNTVLLWWAPAIMAGIGLLAFASIIYRRSKMALDDENEQIVHHWPDDNQASH